MKAMIEKEKQRVNKMNDKKNEHKHVHKGFFKN